MWHNFDLAFLGCMAWEDGEEKVAKLVRGYIFAFSLPTSKLFQDEHLDKAGVYIFHHYPTIHYVGKTSRSFRKRFLERKTRTSPSDQKVWSLIDDEQDYYLLVPTHFAGQVESILLNQGFRGLDQKMEMVALKDFRDQRTFLSQLISYPTSGISFIFQSVAKYIFS